MMINGTTYNCIKGSAAGHLIKLAFDVPRLSVLHSWQGDVFCKAQMESAHGLGDTAERVHRITGRIADRHTEVDATVDELARFWSYLIRGDTALAKATKRPSA